MDGGTRRPKSDFNTFSETSPNTRTGWVKALRPHDGKQYWSETLWLSSHAIHNSVNHASLVIIIVAVVVVINIIIIIIITIIHQQR